MYRQATHGTAYWRLEVPARKLPGKVLGVDVRPPEDGDGYIYPDQEGVAIWQFPGHAYNYLNMAWMKENGIPVVVEVDDNYLVDYKPLKGMRVTWREGLDGDRSLGSREIHRRCITDLADGVICSTEYLAREYLDVHPVVWVCPNSVDPADWQYEKPKDDGKIRVGFCGSASHMKDISLMWPALNWAAQQENVEIHIIGLFPKVAIQDPSGLTVGGWFYRNPFEFPLTHHVWRDSLEEVRELTFKLDIGLCPLLDSHWNRCKSDVKALEYSMAGAASIISDVEPYKLWRNKPALMASNGTDFLRHLRYLVEHMDETRQMAAEAKDWVLKERTIDANVHHWQEVCEFVGG